MTNMSGDRLPVKNVTVQGKGKQKVRKLINNPTGEMEGHHSDYLGRKQQTHTNVVYTCM